jgi:hypothetical protein
MQSTGTFGLKRVRRFLGYGVTAFLLALSSGALAQVADLAPRTVTSVGAHDGPTGFVYFAEPFPFACPFNVGYWDITTPLGKSFLATFNLAKVTVKPVRIWIRPPTAADNVCRVQLAALM